MPRPTSYKEEYNEQVIGLCRLGATDEDIARFFGVCKATINNWKKTAPKFLDSIKEGKEQSDLKVANALYDKALAGDTTAMIFWLKNRRKDAWRDKINQEISAPDGGPISVVERVIVAKDKDTNG